MRRPPRGEAKLDEAVGKALGQPAGVGELMLRSLDRKDAIAADTDADGWYRTGDLARWVPDKLDPQHAPKRLQVLERAAFAVKLANGEFVCPSRLEGLFEGRCASVAECCVLAKV